MDNRHIEPSHFKGMMTQEETEHLVSCPYCREQFTDYIEKHELLTAPRDLKNNILERSHALDVQLIAGSNHLSRRLQLLYFSLKVGTAVLCSLTLLTMMPGLTKQASIRNEFPSWSAQQQTDFHWSYYEKVNIFTEQLNRLSNINMEVINYDKKER